MPKKEKKGRIWIVILLFLLIVVAGFGGYLFYLKSLGTFLNKTSINGYDVSGKKPEEVLSLLEDEFQKTQFVLMENERVDLSCPVQELGFSIDENGTLALVEQSLSMQNKNPIELVKSLMNGKKFRMNLPFTINEDVFTSKVTAANLQEPRVITEDAQLIRREDGTYEVTPEVYGTEFDDTQLQAAVRQEIETQFTGGTENQSALLAGNIEMQLPTTIYKQPQILSTDSSLTSKRDAYNQYCLAKINYQFGSETKTLDWDTVFDWLVLEDGSCHIDEAKVTAYIEDMAMTYNTRHYDRTFHTTGGSTITIDGSLNEYGYIVDQYAEYDQLMNDLAANTEITREPIYVTENDYGNPYFYARNGQDDLAGTYVEINLTSQHLWFYINGSLITESDFVSGDVTTNHGTQTGVFPLAYKKSPDILVGQDYEQEVQYWMPFYEGQGLHDATWRSAFGGSIYKGDGSHGCVNLPLSAAATIYNNIQPGMAIVIYY